MIPTQLGLMFVQFHQFAWPPRRQCWQSEVMDYTAEVKSDDLKLIPKFHRNQSISSNVIKWANYEDTTKLFIFVSFNDIFSTSDS